MRYEFLLFDADQTLFDFNRSERYSFERVMASVGVPMSDQLYADYHVINKSLWEALERGETTRDALAPERYRRLAALYGYDYDPVEVNRRYLETLGTCHFLLPGAQELCERLHQTCRLSIITNGIGAVQSARFAASSLRPYFSDIFISGAIGLAKPDAAYFAHVVGAIPEFDPARALVIGDSLTSDMRGAANASLDSCWFNPEHLENKIGVPITYEVASLEEIDAIVYGN